VANYPSIAKDLNDMLDEIFNRPGNNNREGREARGTKSYNELLAGTDGGEPADAAAHLIALHLAWVTRNEVARRMINTVVWKNVVDWKGVFEAQIHMAGDNTEGRGPYLNLERSSYTGIVRITPLAKAVDGRFKSEIHDWSIQSNPLSVIQGSYKKKGNELKPDAPAPARDESEYEYPNPDRVKVQT